jgi:hypothetical protein
MQAETTEQGRIAADGPKQRGGDGGQTGSVAGQGKAVVRWEGNSTDVEL